MINTIKLMKNIFIYDYILRKNKNDYYAYKLL